MLFFNGSGRDSVVVFDYLPVTGYSADNRGLRELGRVIGMELDADIMIIGGKKAMPATEMADPAYLANLTNTLRSYKNVLFSGTSTAARCLRRKEILSIEYELVTDKKAMGISMLLGEKFPGMDPLVNNRKNKNIRVVAKVSSVYSDLTPVTELLSGIGTITDTIIKTRSRTDVAKVTDMLYTMTDWDGIRVGYTEQPKFFHKKMYEELYSIMLRDLDFVRYAEPINIETEEFTGTLEEFQRTFTLTKDDGTLLPLGLDIESTGLYPWEYYDKSNTNSPYVTGRNLLDPFNPDHMEHSIISLGVANSPDKGWSMLIHHPHLGWNPEGIKILKWICGTENAKTIHNAKYEFQWLQLYYKIELNGTLIDTMVNEHVLNEGMFAGGHRYSLEAITAMRLRLIPHKSTFLDDIDTDMDENKLTAVKRMPDSEIKELELLANSNVTSFREKDFTLFSRTDLHRYGGLDPVLTLRIALNQMQEFRDRGMTKAWMRIVRDLVGRQTRALGTMEYNGFRVHTPDVMDVIHKCDDVIAVETEWLAKELGEGINFSSNAEMTRFIEMNYPALAEELDRTEKGDLEITEYACKEYRGVYPWLPHIFELRHAYKTKGTYMIPFLKFASSGKVHFQFHIAGPATGRLSSSRPNMQNIPKEIAGIQVKTCLKPEPGTVLLNVDLSGAEMRMLANYSGDSALIKMLVEGKDPHSFAASGMYGIPYEDIQKAHKTSLSNQTPAQKELCQLRQNAKPLNFGIVYGISGMGVARQLGCTKNEGEDMIEKFYATYPDVRVFLEKVETIVRENGYIETFMGRRRSFPLLMRNKKVIPKPAMESMLRKAKNFIIQSATSDFFQYLIPELLLPGITPHITVHDSLVFSLNERVLDIKTMYDHFHHVLVERPRELWPELIKIDMKFDIEAGLAYGSKYSKNITAKTASGIIESCTAIRGYLGCDYPRRPENRS
jgi:DNA polymerase I-like protein with 3'-5' exonuclease and polymerase domains